MVGDADGVGDDGEGGVDCVAKREEAGVDNIEIIEVMDFAIDVEDGCLRAGTEATGTVLVADAFEGMRFLNSDILKGSNNEPPVSIPHEVLERLVVVQSSFYRCSFCD